MNAKNFLVAFSLCIAVMYVSACSSMQGPTISQSSQTELAERAKAALDELYNASPVARGLQSQVTCILVFPGIIRAGVFVGGSGGNGVLLSPDGQVLGYYNTAAASFGLQFGAENYSQALFLVTPAALQYLEDSAGWSVGVGPHVVVVDIGAGKDVSSTTLRPDVFSFVFGQKGLMGALAIQGQKITKLGSR